MSVQYKANSVNVSDNINQNLMIYAHPDDVISFDFDISALNKEIVNGDLVIHLLNGKNITVVNFGLMVLDNNSPRVEDINRSYNPFSLFDGEAYYEEDVGRYVISRVISSPEKLSALEGEELPSSKDIANGEGVFSKQVGNFLTDEQSLVPEFAPLVQDYITKTLQHANTKLYESDVYFTSQNQFSYNEIDSDIFPIKLLLINPKVTPEYGTDYRTENSINPDHRGYKDLFVDIGGGRLKGDDFAELMYTPTTIDLSNTSSDYWFDGPTQNNKIIRYFHVGIPSQSVLFTKVIINGLPSGIVVASRPKSNLEIKPLGAGTFEINIRGAAAGGVEIPIEYVVGLGGNEGVFSSVGINYEGVQARTGDLVKGNNTVYFEFKPVHGPDDVSNFSKYNTYTFSTLRDPLIIRFGSGSDIIKGGYGDYIYYGTAGDNKAYGGYAKEEFYLGVGNNKFYAGVGNATVDVENLTADNRLYLSDALEIADQNSVNTIVDNGGIIFTGKYKGATFSSFIKNFSNVYFDIGDNDKVTDRNDTVTINSTWGMALNTALHMGNGNNLVKAGSNSILVDFKIFNGASKSVFITTHNTSTGVFVKWGNGDNRIIGSLANDTIIGYNDNESVSFDGNGGINTADYSGVTTNLTYDASSGIVTKEGQSSLDKVVGIQKFIGGNLENIFYGSVYYTSFDGIEKQSNIEFYNSGSSSKSKLSYSRLKSISSQDKKENGVIIDLTNNSVTKIKTGGVDRFNNINFIEASNNNDTFIVSSDVKSTNLNGLGGFNTVDYSRSVVQVDFNINEACSGSVTKGNGTHGIDIINNFRHFIGSTLGSTFSLNDFKFEDKSNPYRFIIEGKSDPLFNKVNYSTVSGKAIVVDMRLNEPFLATLYSGKTSNSSIIGVDLLINIGVFGLTNESDNIVYMYSQEQLVYVLDSGTNGNNLISFEKTDKPVSINFHGNNFNNINGFSVLKLSKGNDKIIMGAGFFAQEIDGNGGINEIDFSNLSSPIISDINLENIELTKINIGSKNIKVKNFNRIIATASDDVFNIKFDLVNINKIKNKDILFDGSQGMNVINFLQVKNSANSSEGLIIDISDGVLSKVTDSASNNVLSFLGFSSIIGSQGNDVFILPASAFDFTIDGGGGTLNTVSYQAYTQGIHISEEILSRFKNIHKIIGSQGNDFVSLNESTNLHVDGFSGFNTALYNGTINSAVIVDVEDKLLSIKKGNKTDVLSHIEVVDFSSSVVNGGITFNIKTLDNSKIVTGGAIYFCGSATQNATSNNKIDYSTLSSGITLNLDVITNLPSGGFWLSINKGNNNIDYIQNMNRIVLSKNSQVNIYDSVGALTNINKMEIDGNGTGILSFSKYNGTVFIDVTVSTMKFGSTLEITFLGFNNFEGAGGTNFSTTFLSNDDKSYTFNGLLSVSKLSYEKIASELNIVIKGANAKGYNEFEIKKSNNSDIAYNIMNLRGSKGNTNIILEKDIDNDMTFEAESGSKSKISYENLVSSGVLIFAISKDGVTAGRSSGLFKDKIINFTDIIGSKGNNRFEIDASVLQSSIVYNINGGIGGINTINFASFDTDVAFKMDTAGLIKVNLGQRDFGVIYNMSYIFGTSTKNNSFVLGNFFNKKSFVEGNTNLSIYGNSSKNTKDILDLRDTNNGLSLDPLIGRISLIGNEKVNIIASSGIHTIYLGNGDHQVDISSGVSAVGWKVINGGTGSNNISFSKLLSGIVYDLSSGIKDLDFVLVNFTGVTGSKGNDTFILKAVNENIKGMRIDGYEGSLNTLDYSDLNVEMKINIASKSVLRGSINDVVTNIQIFKTGKGGAEIKVNTVGNFQFFGNENAIDKNTLSYEGIDKDIIFNFTTKSIVKDSSNYDSFSGISRFIGGSSNNTFLFSTEALNTYVTNVLLDGGTGKNNVVNLSRLSFGITYDIAKKFFTINYNNKTLRVNLENIHQIIGTSKADTFIFDDTINDFNANGGINEAQFKNTVDLSKVSSGVSVDFINRTIVFGNNKNNFSNIEKFIGSKAGGNIFRGLSSNSCYEIDGGTSEFINGGNTIEYSGASTGLVLSVKNGDLNINKSGDLVDVFKNIHNLKLSSLLDELIFNSSTDLAVYGKFKIIDGGLGDNLVSFSSSVVSNTIVLNMDTGSISIGNSSANIKIVCFNSFKFANGSGQHTVIAGAGNFNFRLIEFGETNNSTLDLTKVSESLVIGILEDGVTSTISGNISGNRGTLINLKNLLLGNGVYSLNFVKFNSNSMRSLNVKAGATATTNLIVDQYVGNNAKIDISGRNIKLDSSSFSSVSNVSIYQAPQSVNVSFSSKLIENGIFNFYLNNSTIANSNVTLTLASSVSGSADDVVAINSNNNITLRTNNGDKVFSANLLTNNGSLNIDYDSPKLNINTFNTSFKNISIKSSTIDLNFSELTFNSQGIFYDLNLTDAGARNIEIKEGVGASGSYKVKLTNTSTDTSKIFIYGSSNSDTFKFKASKDTSLMVSIKEDGSVESLNSLFLNIEKENDSDTNVMLSANQLRVGLNLNFNFSGTRKVNIFSFESSGSYLFNHINIQVAPTIKHVTLPKLSSRNSSSSNDIILPLSESKGAIQASLNFLNTNMASGFIHYGAGYNFTFDNFYFGKNNLSASSIMIEFDETVKREDIFTIYGNIGKFEFGELSIVYFNRDNSNYYRTFQSTMDFSKWDIFNVGFELSPKSSFKDNSYVMTFSNKFKLSFNGATKILLNVTDATNNALDEKHIIKLPNAFGAESDVYFSFGNLNDMKLPNKYRILVDSSGLDFPANDLYPVWQTGSNKQGRNDPRYYETYNNVFIYNVAAGGTINANLNLNGNNESIFRSSSDKRSITVSGANLFWIGDNKSDIINVKVHEINKAKPFALMLKFGDSNVIDFSEVKDNQDYLFRFVYGGYARDNHQITTITSLPKEPGTFPLDNDMKVFGNFSGAKKVILTSSKNTVYVHGVLSTNEFTNIDGGSGLTTVSFSSNLANKQTVDFTNCDGKGFKMKNAVTDSVVDILFSNIKIIESGYRLNYQGLDVIFNTYDNFNQDFNHSFIVRQPKNLSGEYVSKLLPITFKDKADKTSIYLNNKYALFTSGENKGNFAILAEDFGVTNFVGRTSIFYLGLNIDFSNLASNNKEQAVIQVESFQYTLIFLPKYTDYTNYFLNLTGSSKEVVIQEKVSRKSIVIKSNLDFEIHKYDTNKIDSDMENGDTTTISYYEFLAANPLFQLTEGNNAYNMPKHNINKDTDSSPKVVAGSIVWPNQFDFESSLTVSVVNEKYWKDVDTRIKNAFLDDDKDNKKEIIDNINADQDSIVKQYHEIQKELSKTDNYEEDNSNSNHSNNTYDTSVENIPEELALNDSNTEDFNGFDLNSILEAAKSITEDNIDNYNNHSTVLDAFSIDLIPIETIESTFMQDEANSMSYTIDTTSSAMSSFHSSLDGNTDSSSTHEQQKNKFNY